MLVEQCALMHMFFGNNQGVRLLEHVRLLERIWYLMYGAWWSCGRVLVSASSPLASDCVLEQDTHIGSGGSIQT